MPSDPAARAAVAELLDHLTARDFDADRVARFAALCDRLRRDLDLDTRVALADALRRDPPIGDTIRVHSVLFQLTGDLYHYERILHYLLFGMEDVAPELLHYTFWCLQRQIFMGMAAADKAAAFVPCDLFRFYRAMVGTLARRWSLTPARRAPRPGPIRRVAVVTNQFTGEGHQPTRDAFDIARRLQDEHGLEVAIINANLMPLRIENLFIPPMVVEMVERYEGVRLMEMFGHRVKTASFTGRAFDRAKVADIVSIIDEYDPDVLIAFGGTNIVCDLFAVAGARPVVCVPTTSGITMSLADILLGFDEHDYTADIPALYRAPFARRFRPFSFGYTLPPTDAGATGDPGLPPGAFVFAVVGTRLDQEADDAFLALAEAVLDRCPGAVVAFAGPVRDLPARLAASRHAGRLLSTGHIPDIRAFYRRCGALLNPRRQGGGASAAYALAEGVPVVTFPGGDVASVTGPRWQVADAAAYVARAAALCADPALRAAEAEAARDRFATVVDRRHSIDRLLRCAEEARTLSAAGEPAP
ncbi:glycosyltransferase [Azospirillum halopraeferens]|uniref:glycosyltransferase n=1 Tax=Azospirillum halopraeferens TaxID=34010 RepID=UPI000428BC49|nr:glycosyltransferase [Azospirillum halopraeferens]